MAIHPQLGRSKFEQFTARLGSRLPCLTGVILALSSTGCLRLRTVATAGAEPPSQMMDTTSKMEVWEVQEETHKSGHFILDGKPFCFSGTNNYYLPWKSTKMCDDVLVTAKAMNLAVIRTWGAQDRGSLDGSMPNTDGDGTKEGVYYQYWDPATKHPAYNDDLKTGLGRLDYVLHKARELGLKVILTLTNNWKDTGGMDQYVKWYGRRYHHEFFTDREIRGAFKDWSKHLIEHVNAIDGVAYRDDPAIFCWQLANEPRMRNYEKYDSPDGWDKTTMVQWADDMSAYIKSLDPNHMVSVGDEGFLNSGGHWLFDAMDNGVDQEALTAVKHIDFATFHVYPDNWQTGLKILRRFIQENLDVARKVGKPTVMEEYGVTVRRNAKGEISGGWERRENAYRNWNELLMKGGAAGSMFWILSGYDDHLGIYPDHDGYTLYKGDRTHQLLAPYFQRFPTEAQACKGVAANLGTPSPFVKATRMHTVAVLDVPTLLAAVGAGSAADSQGAVGAPGVVDVSDVTDVAGQ